MLLLMALAVFTTASNAQGATTLRPLGKVETIPIGRTAKAYLVISDEPVVFPVIGPGTLTMYARVAMPTDTPDHRKGTLTLNGLNPESEKIGLNFPPSRSTKWTDNRPGNPSAATKLKREVPAGERNLEISASVIGGGPMLVILYYDGPDQPEVPGLQAPISRVQVPAAKSSKKSAWSFRGNAAMDVIYNTNILTNSPEYLDDFQSGVYPWKFQHKSDDDLVLAYGFDIEARRNLLSWGQSRFKFKFKQWKYTHNDIKTNTDFHFYVRQFFGKKKSLEGYFHFAPEQYIGELSDRSPLDDPDDPINWAAFRFQRNVWNLTYRQTMSKKLSVKFLYEENYRYYNQPFMENDISAWEIRGNAAYKFNKIFTMNLDYSFEDGDARGLDEPHETILTSNNSDGSYNRDLYRFGLTIKHPALKKYIRQADFSFLFMDYYYTTDKTLAQDPYHAGRRDTYYKVTGEVRRKLTKSITAKAAVRRTQRVVYSPWEGDITTDKDFIQWLYWINLSYRF